MLDNIRISSDLYAVPHGVNCAVIIRHADRNGALNQVVKESESLNKAGMERSERFGMILAHFSDMRTYSSPVGRCIDTCIHISKGFGHERVPNNSEMLGMSAPFMVDPKGAYAKMQELGLVGFVDEYVNDKLDPALVLPCAEGTQMLFSYVIERIKDMRNGVGVFVTHDMIITPAMAYYFGYDFKNKGLAPFLDGIVLYESNGSFIARHGRKEVKVDRSGKPIKNN